MAKDPHRHRRVESEIQRVVSELLLKEVSDPRIGRITITAVKVSPGLEHATLYYTAFGKNQQSEELQTGLTGAARFMRGPVGRRLKLRIAPELHFKADVQLLEGLRLGALIDAAVAADGQRNAQGGTDAAEQGEAGASADRTSEDDRKG